MFHFKDATLDERHRKDHLDWLPVLLRPSNIAAAHILGLHNRIATTIKKLNRQKLMQNFYFYLIFNFAFILQCSQPTLSLAHIRKFGTKGLK